MKLSEFLKEGVLSTEVHPNIIFHDASNKDVARKIVDTSISDHRIETVIVDVNKPEELLDYTVRIPASALDSSFDNGYFYLPISAYVFMSFPGMPDDAPALLTGISVFQAIQSVLYSKKSVLDLIAYLEKHPELDEDVGLAQSSQSLASPMAVNLNA